MELPTVAMQTDVGIEGVHVRDPQGQLRMGAPLVLNVYYVSVVQENVRWVNGILRHAGAGAFHAGLEVYGQEWSYGFRDWRGTGVYPCTPREAPHCYRESVGLGITYKNGEELRQAVEEFAIRWKGEDYDVLGHNCCHFCEALSK